MSALARLIATWFYCGYFPKGPGTAGSIGALIAVLPLALWTVDNRHLFIALPILGLLPAIWAADRMAKDTGSKDPQTVVVDEVIGQWIALAAVPDLSVWYWWLAAFLLFRALDITKPWPVRPLEKIPGGAGIVLDDVGAGIYAALVLVVLGWFNQ